MIEINLTAADNTLLDDLLLKWPTRAGDAHRSAARKARESRLGIRGEYVVARLLGQDVYEMWKKHDYVKFQADVGRAVQVKSTDKENGNLCIPQYDRDYRDCVFVACRVLGDRVQVLGWVKGDDAMRPAYYRENYDSHRDYWLFPAELLNPDLSQIPPEYVR